MRRGIAGLLDDSSSRLSTRVLRISESSVEKLPPNPQSLQDLKIRPQVFSEAAGGPPIFPPLAPFFILFGAVLGTRQSWFTTRSKNRKIPCTQLTTHPLTVQESANLDPPFQRLPLARQLPS